MVQGGIGFESSVGVAREGFFPAVEVGHADVVIALALKNQDWNFQRGGNFGLMVGAEIENVACGQRRAEEIYCHARLQIRIGEFTRRFFGQVNCLLPGESDWAAQAYFVTSLLDD